VFEEGGTEIGLLPYEVNIYRRSQQVL
jgi:hypothetical protein